MLHHSAAVHIPLALSILLPLVYIVIWISIWKGWFSHRTWILVLGLALIQVTTSALSYMTGLRDRLLSPADAELLNLHQQYAGHFTFLWAVALLLIPAAFLSGKRLSIACHGALLVLFFAQLARAFQLGIAGGEIVFGK